MVPESDSDDDDNDDDDDDEETTFDSLLKNLKVQIRGAAAPPTKKKKEEVDASNVYDPKHNASSPMDREKSAVAHRTLELLEARRLAEVAFESTRKKNKKRHKNYVDKRCEVGFTRQKLDEEFAAAERGPRFINNTAIFLKKGEKLVDTKRVAAMGVQKADGSIDMTAHKSKSREERMQDIQQGLR